MWTPEISTSEAIAIEASANLGDTEMAPGEVWRFCPTVACWIKQGDENVVATADAPSMYVPAGGEVFLEPGFDQGARLSVIRHSGDGIGTLTRMRYRAE